MIPIQRHALQHWSVIAQDGNKPKYLSIGSDQEINGNTIAIKWNTMLSLKRIRQLCPY